MLSVERLEKHHDRNGFDCGNKILNDFLQKHARQHAEREISRTFVLTNDTQPKKIVGYYTLAVCEVIPNDIPDPRLERYPHPMPAAKLARLAVCSHNQGNGIGEKLLLNAMERSLSISENAGLIGMFVDAKDDKAAGYYRPYGFIPTENDHLILYLPIATMRQAFE